MDNINNVFKEHIHMLYAHPTIASIGAVVLSVFNFMYGTGITMAIAAIFIAVLFLDLLSGRAASKKDGSFASEYGINGAYRTAFIVFILAVAYRTDLVLISRLNLDELGYPLYPLFYYLITNFGLPMWRSMTANVYRAGWDVWIPKGVLERISDEIEHKTARANKRIQERKKYLDGDDNNGNG